MVTFKNLVFDFSTTSGQITDGYEANEDLFALIHAVDGSVSLTIENCEFKRPTSGEVKFHLVKVSAGSLTMSTVDCTEESKTNADAITFSATPFLVEGTSDVTLISLNLKKITSKESAVVKVKSANKVVIKLDKCTFTECISTVDTTSGALYVESENVESTFTIGNTGETKFENCTCAKGKAGAIYLKMIGITEATQLSWPETGTNLKFTSCAAGEGDSKKNTALYLNVPVTLHEEIAAAMKASFATDYKRGTNDWFVAANSEDGDVDFTSNYFDLPIVYVKKDGNDENGNTYENPMGNLSKAYELFEEIKSASGFTIKIIKETDAKNVLTADAVEFNKETGVRIVGVTKANEEETETEVTLDCKVEIGKDLFTCKKKVEFRGITFKFPLSLDAPKESNTGASSLIVAETDSVSLTINKCKFVRPESVAHSNDEEIAKIHLVNVKAGELEMSGVECKGDNEVKFQESLFVISESSSVKFDTVEINKVSMTDGAVISIRDATDKASTVKIEGLTMNEVKSANGLSAGIMIKMADNGSKVEMGREKKCSFKSCEAEKGDSGAIFIEMKEIVSNLKLPGEGKLEFDNNNKGKDSSVASLCIIAPDFDEYSKQEDAFGFAKDYNDDNKGWIVGAKKEGDNLEDVYEKYLKHKEPKDEPEPEKKKSNAGTVVAIVVPIVVVVIVVVVVIIAIIVVRKKRSRNN
ncbi:uncharacterized protein MONOS_14680 [Monocercomonoides exilis]|uniref:uncharacterized protein n=1 Tax=Monocercomonoides exilis TaxID=2049356 RepID=UPI00355A4CF1|nr:hypothetical protein MONOS_14680 [Monocercomonoides exilis]|eukprot:MONOS_14680.1-p1 / transcript=MONOS_14680.1 / gene=MONOS_14680 / organism=Monocercomonoides_exilis_PA203 / gene_product=unspecified product / transcript_product=unspecified product / location=Mono_scaffold01050:110-2203(+) / protein_length=698 / sequence_SO=supercontig / SO=protein_coding / is_pseudo=false